MVWQTCHEKKCSGLISLQLDSLIWETASPRTHKPKTLNESLSTVHQSQAIDYKPICLICIHVGMIGSIQ